MREDRKDDHPESERHDEYDRREKCYFCSWQCNTTDLFLALSLYFHISVSLFIFFLNLNTFSHQSSFNFQLWKLRRRDWLLWHCGLWAFTTPVNWYEFSCNKQRGFSLLLLWPLWEILSEQLFHVNVFVTAVSPEEYEATVQRNAIYERFFRQLHGDGARQPADCVVLSVNNQNVWVYTAGGSRILLH